MFIYSHALLNEKKKSVLGMSHYVTLSFENVTAEYTYPNMNGVGQQMDMAS